MNEACEKGLRVMLSVVAAPDWTRANAMPAPEGQAAPPGDPSPPGDPAPKANVAGSFGNWTLLCGKEGDDKTAEERCSRRCCCACSG